MVRSRNLSALADFDILRPKRGEPLVNHTEHYHRVACVILSVLLPAIAAGQSWRQFGGETGNWTVESVDLDLRKLQPALKWKAQYGEGRSSLVVDGDQLFVFFGDNKTGADKTVICRETLIAVDRTTGKQKWRFDDSSIMHADQETFSGAAATPQATPAIAGDRIFCIGFTGKLHCINKVTGSVIWNHDLVSDLGGDPVQFGYSSSPVAVDNRVYVLAAGEKGGLFCLSGDDGKTIWLNRRSGPSYSTPIITNIAGTDQIVFVTEDNVASALLETGQTLWSYKLPKPEMTNVPTPLVANENSLLISGQGSDGTRRLEIRHDDSNGWTVNEKWHNRQLGFFYCNWLRLDDQTAIGCTDKYMAAFDMNSGKMLGRWRGYGNGNIIKVNGSLVTINGNGRFSHLVPSTSGLEEVFQFSTTKGRCWAPPTIVDQHLYLRSGNTIACYELNAGRASSSQFIQNELSKTKTLDYDSNASERVDVVEQIVSEFNDKGQDAAIALYEKRRKQTPSLLGVPQRLELANLAEQQGLIEVARMMLAHTVDDYPDSDTAKNKLKEFSDRHPPK